MTEGQPSYNSLNDHTPDSYNDLSKLAWLAGFIDGDGHIGIAKRPSKSDSISIIPVIQLVNTDPLIITEIKSICQTHNFAHHIQERTHKKWKTRYYVHFSGFKRANRILNLCCIRFLKGKRQKAEWLSELVNSRLKSGPQSPYSSRELELIAKLDTRS